MLAVADALALVLGHAKARPARPAELAAMLRGRILAEDVACDRDMPPFDKALMDGFAVRSADLGDGRAELPVAATVMAGQAAPPLAPGQAIRIMTGAPIPAGADAVIRVEDTAADGGRVRIATRPPRPGQFILFRGREMTAGEVIAPAGTVLTPPVLGLLAAVGRTSANVIPPPTAAVLATGDELVAAGVSPGPTQLRNSNGPMLLAQCLAAGAEPRDLGIARDDRAHLRALIETGLRESILILSGGVSAGQKDLVPDALQSLGVAAHVHQIAMKPGKPFFFGTRGDTLVFGLPGNPVSSFCCFELFVRPAIRKLGGYADPGPDWRTARLTDPFEHASDRPTYHPAVLRERDGVREATPAAWFGSPDLRGLARANGLILLPAGKHAMLAGASVPALILE